MRFATLAGVAAALISAASASTHTTTTAPVVIQYTVNCQKTYIVKNGDTCSEIGKAFNVYTSSIKKWNPSINARCTNLYIDQILCLSPPTTSTNAMAYGTSAILTPTPAPKKTTTSASQLPTTVLTMSNSGPECTKDSDCAGSRCCNLSSNQCVLDPYDNICGIKPTSTAGVQSISAISASTCTSGSQGLKQGDGYNGACCDTQADCWDDCISGVCNGPVNTKTTVGAAATTTASSSTCTSGSQGLKQGDGYNGACCNTQADCWDDCIKGVCNGPVNTKTTVGAAATTTASSSSSTCTAGSQGLKQGDGYNGACCNTQADCWDDCISGVCNGPVNTKTATKTTTAKTTTAKTTTATSTATCTAGSQGLKKGDGYNGACCATQADCLDDCIKGVCNGPVNTKTATKTATKTTTTKTATATSTAVPSGLTVQISSSKDFCLFLPSSPGNKLDNNGKQDTDAIADSEKNAVTFCTKPNVNAPAAAAMPEGFILSASYQTNSAAGFVQVRGTLDISAYELSSKDEGGQYDNHGSGSPPNSACAGYPYFVSLIEPNTATFCIRCCDTYSDCNAGRSAYGCDRVVPAL